MWHKTVLTRTSRQGQAVPIAPAGDPAFAPLFDPSMRWPVRRARLQVAVRSGFQRAVVVPAERRVLGWWRSNLPGAATLEGGGLPRRAIEEYLDEALTLHVNPRALIRSADWRGYPHKLRPSSSAFVWDGEWDLRRADLRFGSRYRFISELDVNRDDLTTTERFEKLKNLLDSGRPWSSHQQGILLDSEDRILLYLKVYLSFLDDMAIRGFDGSRGKDELGVAITREGTILKINRGLHRLAMAQRLGLPSVPVRVRAVHREWWQRTAGNARGDAALDKVALALQDCMPEQQAGELDPTQWPATFEWPATVPYQSSAARSVVGEVEESSR